MARFPALIAAVLLVSLTTGCDTGPAPTPQRAASTVAPQPTGQQVLDIEAAPDLIDPGVLSAFEGKFGARVNLQPRDTAANLSDVDIIVLADSEVEDLRAAGSLTPLNKANIPNLKNIDPAFLNPSYDPGNRYSVPYVWFGMGIGYNINKTGRDIRSFGDLLNPAFAGRISLINYSRDMLSVVLLYLGYSPSTSNPRELAEARQLLEDHKSQFAGYADDNGQDLLAAGKVDIAVEYGGDIVKVADDHPEIRFAYPKEGALYTVDALVMPAGLHDQDLAEKFINFMNEPQQAAANANYLRYGTTNMAARPFLNPRDRDNPALYPPQEVTRRFFSAYSLDPDTQALYDKTWDAIIADYGP